MENLLESINAEVIKWIRRNEHRDTFRSIKHLTTELKYFNTGSTVDALVFLSVETVEHANRMASHLIERECILRNVVELDENNRIKNILWGEG